jgi:hypothetical protein
VALAVDGSSRTSSSTRADAAIGDGQRVTEGVRRTPAASGQGPDAATPLPLAAVLWLWHFSRGGGANKVEFQPGNDEPEQDG